MYEVEFTSEAEADLDHLSKSVVQRILKKIRWLAENFEVITPEPLTGEWKGLFKLRVGDYRVLYTYIPTVKLNGKLSSFIWSNIVGKFINRDNQRALKTKGHITKKFNPTRKAAFNWG